MVELLDDYTMPEPVIHAWPGVVTMPTRTRPVIDQSNRFLVRRRPGTEYLDLAFGIHDCASSFYAEQHESLLTSFGVPPS